MPGRGGCRKGAGRKAIWQDRETQTIRVPIAIKEQLLDIGKELDQGEGFLKGSTCKELQAIVDEWLVKCEGNDSPQWQPVGQLLDEIQAVLSKRTIRACRRRRMRNGSCHSSSELEMVLDD